MAVTAVNFDITLYQGPGSYMATASVQESGGANVGAIPMRLTEPGLLGTVTLADLYRADGAAPPAMGVGASEFVQSLVKLRDGFYTDQDVERVGKGLYDAFPDAVLAIYNQLWGAIKDDKTKLLRVRLCFDAPELARLPWEFLKIGDTFLLEHRRRSLVRFPRTGDSLGKVQSPGKLKILIWAANPVGTEPLEFQDEVNTISDALKSGLAAEAEVVLRVNGTAADLLSELQDGGYHVLHYIGHGTYDQASGKGVLEFDPGNGAPAAKVNGVQLRQGILDNDTLSLVFLNSCETATGSTTNAYAALGFDLARFTPAVIAMQTLLVDDSGVVLAKEFYRAFSAGADPIDVCLIKARKALIASFPERPMDWGIPALFSRADLDVPVPLAPAPPAPAPLAPAPVPNPNDPVFIDRLVSQLLQCQSMSDAGTRKLIVSQLPPDVQNAIDPSGSPKVLVTNIVQNCLRFPNGFKSLIERVRYFEGPSFAMQAVDNYLAENG